MLLAAASIRAMSTSGLRAYVSGGTLPRLSFTLMKNVL